jgi:hypothetical protein
MTAPFMQDTYLKKPLKTRTKTSSEHGFGTIRVQFKLGQRRGVSLTYSVHVPSEDVQNSTLRRLLEEAQRRLH